MDRVSNLSNIILPLSIYLGHHFEFRSLHFSKTHVYGYPEKYLGPYEKIYDGVLFARF